MATIAEELAKLAVVDDLNRTESPLTNVKGEPAKGTWVLLKPSKLKGKVELSAVKGWTPLSSFAEGRDGAYYSKTSYAAGAQYIAALFRLTEYAKPVTGTRDIGVWVYRDKTAPETKESGYFLRIENVSGEGATLKLKFKIEKWVSGAITVLKEVETAAGKYGAESRFALVVGGGKLLAFASTGKATAFEQVAEIADATYSEGYSGIFAGGAGTMAMQDFATGILEVSSGEEEAGVIKPNSASAEASSGEGTNVANHVVEVGEVPSAAASMPNIELVGGAMPSGSEHEVKGLPLPFPSVLANPARLGPPRFTALERKTLGLDR